MTHFAFIFARHLVPIAAALAAVPPTRSSWLLAGAALASAGIPRNAGKVVSAVSSGKPVDRGALVLLLGASVLTLALGAAGFFQVPDASAVALPTALLGIVALGASLFGLSGGPSLVETAAAAAPTPEEQAILYPQGGVPIGEPTNLTAGQQWERDRVVEQVNTRGQVAAIGYVAGLVIESSAALFAAMLFAAIMVASGAPSFWAWEGAGAFALAFAAAGAAVARMSSADEGEPLTAFGGVLLIAFIAIAVAVANGWTVMLSGAPMVVLSMLITIIKPARHRRVVDVILCLVAIATGVGVAYF
ncbi:hypothetical protein [Polyangium sp. y55x31]|uniref:hypothetical protein n=1 Tax=Polyangium sp. y55x31 TaxID=3042688 RepID=UPI0024830E84|nr:hypothetical protein [Polyangium sp. y55x31]MDI1480685.1 hypothetical protein [Polyangium sp. y55x31]